MALPTKLGLSTAAVEPRQQAWTSSAAPEDPLSSLPDVRHDAIVDITTTSALDLDVDSGVGVGSFEECLPGSVFNESLCAYSFAPKASSALCIEYCNSRYVKCSGRPTSGGRRAEIGKLESGVAAEMGGLWEKVCAGKRSLRAKISKHPLCFR